MNNVYIYDNSFKSLLDLIWCLLENKIVPFNIKDRNYNADLFDNLIYLKIEDNSLVYKKLFGVDNYKIIYYVYLSMEKNKELIIYYYILNYLNYRTKLKYMRNLKCVSEALRISNYVQREAHKFKGFLRFKELDSEVLYGEINPTNNILGLISIHFQDRLKNHYWIIKDVNRGIISLYDKNKFYLLDEKVFKLSNISLSDKELKMEELWQCLYKTISIEQRKNERCRMNFMPKKYWKYIIEVSDEDEKSC